MDIDQLLGPKVQKEFAEVIEKRLGKEANVSLGVGCIQIYISIYYVTNNKRFVTYAN